MGEAALSVISRACVVSAEPGCWAGDGPAGLVPRGPGAFSLHLVHGRGAQPGSPQQISAWGFYIPLLLLLFLTWWLLGPDATGVNWCSSVTLVGPPPRAAC